MLFYRWACTRNESIVEVDNITRGRIVLLRLVVVEENDWNVLAPS